MKEVTKKVRCINAKLNPFKPEKELELGRVYTVIEEDPIYYNLVSLGFWRKARFEEVECE